MELLATYYRGVLCKTYGPVTPGKASDNPKAWHRRKKITAVVCEDEFTDKQKSACKRWVREII